MSKNNKLVLLISLSLESLAFPIVSLLFCEGNEKGGFEILYLVFSGGV